MQGDFYLGGCIEMISLFDKTNMIQFNIAV